MAKRKLDADNERKKAQNSSFYLAEAFFVAGDSEQSMNVLVPKFLEAKTKDEIEAVYRQHIADHRALGKESDVLEIAIRDYYSEQECFDDPTPIYAKWIYYSIQSASALLELYTVCLRVVRQESKKSAIVNIMDMLHYSNKAFETMFIEVKNKEYTLKEVYDHFHHALLDYHDIPNFPLVFFFRDFQRNYGKDLQQKYGFSYNPSKTEERYQYHYWKEAEKKNSNAKREIKDLLWAAATNSDIYDEVKCTLESWQGDERIVCITPDNYADDIKHLKRFDDRWLAERILGILDRHAEKRLSNGVQFKIDAPTGKINVASSAIETALFLWIITQIQNTEDYRICKICGQVFKVGSQKTRQYCCSHSKAAIDYFNRKLRKQNQETEG